MYLAMLILDNWRETFSKSALGTEDWSQ